MCRLKRVNHLLAAAPLLVSGQICRYSAGIGHRRRKWVPQELSTCVITLTCDSSADGGTCNVHLVASDHDCLKSRQQVQAAVQFFKPEAVFLELCSSRTDMLKSEEEKSKVLTIREMVNMWKKNHKPSWIFFKWYESMVYKNDDVCGGDMRTAVEEAMKCGAKVILGDRPIDITTQRYLAKTSLLDLLVPKSDAEVVPQQIANKLRGRFHAYVVDHLNKKIAKKYPVWAETYINERDRYMSAKLLEVAREHNSVVAVVGMGHIPGMKKNWKQPVDMEQLLSIPSVKKPITVASVGRSIVAVLAMAEDLLKVTLRNIKRSRS